MIRLSIIIVIYNVSRYIRQGLSTLMPQVQEGDDVIIVDDGSTDGSSALCDEMAATYPSVRVIHQANAGAGPARNTGIEAAQGEYILFYDVDDRICDRAISTIRRRLSEKSVDMLIYGYDEVNPGLGTRFAGRFENCEFITPAALRSGYTATLSGLRFNNGFVWNKAYRRAFLNENNIRFESLRIQQDEVFNIAVYRCMPRVRVVDDILYEYYVYNTGNNRSRYIPERLDIYKRVRQSFLDIIKEWDIDSPELQTYVHRRFITSVIQHITYNLYSANNDLSDKAKRRMALDAMTCPETRESISVLQGAGYKPGHPVERLYFTAIAHTSPALYTVGRHLDALTRRLRALR